MSFSKVCSLLNCRYGTDSNVMLFEDVSCSSSNYLVLLQCSVAFQHSSYCSSDSRDAFVVCCKYNSQCQTFKH